MKFALIVAFGFILADCQLFYYYHPSPVNQLAYQPRYYPLPLPWYRPAEEGEQDAVIGGAEDDQQQETRESPDVASPRFLFGGLANNNNYLFALNTNFALKTRVYTTIKTKTVVTTSLCLPSTGVISGATTCSRRRRDIEAALSLGYAKSYKNTLSETTSDSLQPSPILAVETTLLPSDSYATDASPAISSSIADGNDETTAVGVLRSRRFFTAARYTYTSWKFTTTTVEQPLKVRFLQNYDPCPFNNSPPDVFPPAIYCVFDCVPPGYSLCTSAKS